MPFLLKKIRLTPLVGRMISRSQNSMFWLVYDLPVPEPDTYDIEERFKTCCLIIKWLDDKRHSRHRSNPILVTLPEEDCFVEGCVFLLPPHSGYTLAHSDTW